MFSVNRCHLPNRVAVERASGQHEFTQLRGRSLRAIASAAGRWSSGVVTSLSWRSATVVLSQSWTPASNSRGCLTWFQVSHSQRCAWNRQNFGEFYVSSAAIGVCAGWMLASVQMRRRTGSRLGSVKDAANCSRKSVASRSGLGSREVPGPSMPSRVPSVSSHLLSFWKVQVRTTMRGGLSTKNVAQTSLRCRCSFGIPQNEGWRSTAASHARKTS